MSGERPAAAARLSGAGCWLARAGRHRRAAVAGLVAGARGARRVRRALPVRPLARPAAGRCMCCCWPLFAGGPGLLPCGTRAQRFALRRPRGRPGAAGAGQRRPPSAAARARRRAARRLRRTRRPSGSGRCIAQRLIASLERLRLAPPRSDLPRRDPWALRAALLLVLVRGAGPCAGRDRRRARPAPSTSAARRAQAAVPPRGRPLGDAARLHPPRRPWSSEQTRGQQRAGGADRQRGAGPGPPSARTRCAAPSSSSARPRPPFDAAGPRQRARPRLELRRATRLLVGPRRRRAGDRAAGSIDVVPDARADGQLRRRAARDPSQRAADRLRGRGRLRRGRAGAPAGAGRRGAERGRAAGAASSRRTSRPSSRAAAILDLTAHPLAGLPVVLQLEAVDAIGQRGQSEPLEIDPAGARVPPSAGARDHRAAAQARGDARDQRRGGGRPGGTGRDAGGAAAADRGAAGAAGGGGAAGDERGRCREPALGGRPALGAGAVHRGRRAVGGRAQAARAAGGAAAGPGARVPRTTSSSG